MKILEITIDPDPYKPFCLAQCYRVGELLFISGQAAIDRNGQLVGPSDVKCSLALAAYWRPPFSMRKAFIVTRTRLNLGKTL